MNRVILLVLSVLMLHTVQAQDIKKALKYVEKGNYDKADEILSVAYRVNKYNAGASFGLAQMYSADDYTNKDYQKAYGHAKEAIQNFSKINKADLDDLKDLISEEKTDALLKTIDNKLFADVQQSNDYAKLTKYLEVCAGSPHYRDALKLRYEFELEAAKKTNTVAAYDKFIEQNQYSDKIDEAKKLRNQAAYNEAKQKNTEAAYSAFLSKYPDSEQGGEIKKLRIDAAFAEAKTANTLQALGRFVDSYPNAPQAAEAKKLLTEAAFKEVSEQNSYEAYNNFLASAPRGELYVKAFNMKTKFMAESFMYDSELSATNTEWVKVIDENTRNDRATSLHQHDNKQLIATGYATQTDTWHNDAWCGLFAQDGTLLWDYKINTPTDDQLKGATFAADNNIYIAGRRGGQFRANERFAYIGKLSADGKLLWENDFDGSMAVSVAATAQSEAIVAGYTDKSDGNREAWVAKFSAAGKPLWTKTFAINCEAIEVLVLGSGDICLVNQFSYIVLNATGTKTGGADFKDNQKAYAATLDNSGNVIVAGRYYNFKEENDTKSDFWVTQLSGGKTMAWSKTYDKDKLHDIATSVTVAADNTICVAGTSAQYNDSFSDDAWVLKLDASGNKKDAQSLGSNENEKSPQIATLNNKIVLLISKGFPADNALIKLK